MWSWVGRDWEQSLRASRDELTGRLLLLSPGSECSCGTPLTMFSRSRFSRSRLLLLWPILEPLTMSSRSGLLLWPSLGWHILDHALNYIWSDIWYLIRSNVFKPALLDLTCLNQMWYHCDKCEAALLIHVSISVTNILPQNWFVLQS